MSAEDKQQKVAECLAATAQRMHQELRAVTGEDARFILLAFTGSAAHRYTNATREQSAADIRALLQKLETPGAAEFRELG